MEQQRSGCNQNCPANKNSGSTLELAWQCQKEEQPGQDNHFVSKSKSLSQGENARASTSQVHPSGPSVLCLCLACLRKTRGIFRNAILSLSKCMSSTSRSLLCPRGHHCENHLMADRLLQVESGRLLVAMQKITGMLLHPLLKQGHICARKDLPDSTRPSISANCQHSYSSKIFHKGPYGLRAMT